MIEKRICPYCKQGVLLKAKVKVINAVVFICDECDTVWKEPESVSERAGKTFDWFAKAISIQPLWDELEILE